MFPEVVSPAESVVEPLLVSVLDVSVELVSSGEEVVEEVEPPDAL